MTYENLTQGDKLEAEVLSRKEADGHVLEFWKELRDHVKEEEAQFKQLYERVTSIEADLQPIKKLYYAVVSSGFIAALLMGSLLYIYHSDRTEMFAQRSDIKELGVMMAKNAQATERTVIMLQNLENDYRRNMERLNK